MDVSIVSRDIERYKSHWKRRKEEEGKRRCWSIVFSAVIDGVAVGLRNVRLSFELEADARGGPYSMLPVLPCNALIFLRPLVFVT